MTPTLYDIKKQALQGAVHRMDLENIKIDDFVLIESGTTGFIKSIGPKNIKIYSSYGFTNEILLLTIDRARVIAFIRMQPNK